jgi:tRNA(Ile)-lysidine synthetase-like protein
MKPGDYIRPLGMGNRKKPVRKILSEMKLTTEERASWPLLAAGKEVFWIYRGPLSERVKLSPGTRKMMQIEIRKKASPDRFPSGIK